MKTYRFTLLVAAALLGLAMAAPSFAALPCLCQVGCTVVNMTTTVYNGTNLCECILGTTGADTINANGGDDSVCSGQGNDTVSGGSGNDFIDGGPDNDTLMGDGGNDTINGRAGNDKIFGGSGSDDLAGGEGDDCLDGGLNPGDHLDGGNGTDTCINLATWTNCEVGTGSC